MILICHRENNQNLPLRWLVGRILRDDKTAKQKTDKKKTGKNRRLRRPTRPTTSRSRTRGWGAEVTLVTQSRKTAPSSSPSCLWSVLKRVEEEKVS